MQASFLESHHVAGGDAAKQSPMIVGQIVRTPLLYQNANIRKVPVQNNGTSLQNGGGARSINRPRLIVLRYGPAK
jgi:hypothetical protein